jgi:hypothetical protein
MKDLGENDGGEERADKDKREDQEVISQKWDERWDVAFQRSILVRSMSQVMIAVRKFI